MKRFLERYFPVIPIALTVLVSALSSPSCANTTEAPTGGDKDSIPPVITRLRPYQYALGVPVQGMQFEFTFDEYVKIKSQQNIFVSPPLAKAPKAKIKGKSVIVWFECDLDSNTTYTIDFTDAIQDNNESNPFPGFTYVFSTGSSIDSMMVTGIVQDCNTLMPIKGATVMLYTDQSDSAVFKQRPCAATKTDDWGYFSIRNIKDTLYRLYAVVDANNDNLYDPESERIAFCDTLIRPVTVVNDSLPELAKYEMTDTAACLARKTEFELNVFREKPSKQFIVNKVRVDDRSSYITFQAQNAHIDTMWIRGIKPDRLISQFNIERDSLEIWVNDRREMPDTLKLFVNYRKTDSLGALQPFTEDIALVNPVSKRARRAARKDLKHEDTICVFKLSATPETVEQYGFQMEFKYPVIYENFDSIKLRVVNPRQQESLGSFTVEPDSMNIRKYTLRPSMKLMEGYEYFLKVPHRAFRDINGHYSDSTEVKVMLPSDEKLSSITVHLSNVCGNTYITDLLTEKRDKVIRSYTVSSDGDLLFPYLSAGKYYIRITEDRNHNGIVDTGSLLEHRQSEKVKFYKIGDKSLIDIQEMTEIEQDIDLRALFDGIQEPAPEPDGTTDDKENEGNDYED